MKLGAEDKRKVQVLAVLGVIMAGSIWYNFFSGPSTTPAPVAKTAVTDDPMAPVASTPVTPTAPIPMAPTSSRQQANKGGKGDDFHPVLRSKRKEDQIDPFNVDPTLHLDMLAKVQDVKLDGGQRNLFQFGERATAAPPVKLAGDEPTVKPKRPAMGPDEYHAPPPIVKAAAPPPPPPPPFTPKYYGLATKQIDGKKTAFFLDGEEIILATEGMTVKKRYKLVRIDAGSVVVQEMESKKEQKVTLSEDAGGNIS